VALGIVSLGTGFYYRHQEKKMLTGSGNKESKAHKSFEGKESKIPASVQKKSESALDKLGL